MRGMQFTMPDIFDDAGALIFDDASQSVIYRETIRSAAVEEGKFVRQSKGVSSYGHCWLRLDSLPEGEANQFRNDIVGGLIPKKFVPAIGDRVQSELRKGPLGGFPVINVRVVVFDGSTQPESTDAAYAMATSTAFRAGFMKANPVLLEPVMKVEVEAPEECAGAVLDNLLCRRGANGEGENVAAGWVPLSEMTGFGAYLAETTGNRGSYSMTFARYSEVPPELSQEIRGSGSQ